MNKIQIFESTDFGTVRTVLIDKEPYFVGKDVAEILGYTNPQKAIRDHVDDEDRTVNDSFTVNGTKGLLINESGLYSLIVASKLPAAKKFKRWVTSEVLPAIRKTGSYTVPKLEKNPKYRTRMIGTAVRDVRSTAAELQKLFGVKSGIALAKATSMIERAYGVEMPEVKELIPPAEHDTGFLNATEIGMRLGVNAREANALLQDAGLQIRFNGMWRLTNKGKAHGEEMPYERNGHSGYQIRWNDSVVSVLAECKTA
jgi:phage antirepressor protein